MYDCPLLDAQINPFQRIPSHQHTQFTTDDPDDYCHFYVEPNISKYGRGARMLNLSKASNSKTNKQDMVMSMLKKSNPNIETIHEGKLTKTIQPLIDPRADTILRQRKIDPRADTISYFLLDKYGIFEPDEGYHIQT
eukprot:568623_1